MREQLAIRWIEYIEPLSRGRIGPRATDEMSKAAFARRKRTGASASGAGPQLIVSKISRTEFAGTVVGFVVVAIDQTMGWR